MLENTTPLILRFRAECEIDALIFLAAAQFDLISSTITAETIELPDGRSVPIPDVTVQMTTHDRLSVMHYAWLAEQIADCHLITQTIAPRAIYTGERDADVAVVPPPPALILHIIRGLREKLPICRERISNAILALEPYALVRNRFRLVATGDTAHC